MSIEEVGWGKTGYNRYMLARRQALQSAAALFGLPLAGAAKSALPDDGLFKSNPDAYWRRIRDEQFYLPKWRAFLNNGSLGIAPKPVVEAVADYLEKSAGLMHSPLDAGEYPRWGYERMDAHRDELAAFIGCQRDELALMHNATEALSTVAAGLDLAAGDEVILTDKEHTSCKGGWLLRQARHGIKVKYAALPVVPKNPGELADVLISAIGPRTKVLAFSGMISPTGWIMPIKEICAAARAKGVMTMVDAAHMHGQVALNVSDTGCDFMVGSPHKWLFAPAGCGFLYVREEMQERLWPAITTEGWQNKDLKAARYMQMGTNNRALMEGMVAGLRFAKSIGPERIYGRIHDLAKQCYAKASALPYLEMRSPADDRMYGCMVSFVIPPATAKLYTEMCTKRRIWITGGEHPRVSFHIHSRPEDIDLYFETLREAHRAVGGKNPPKA